MNSVLIILFYMAFMKTSMIIITGFLPTVCQTQRNRMRRGIARHIR